MGVTGLEPVPFCDFIVIEECGLFFGHVYNWAHEKMAQFGTDWRWLARAGSDSMGWSTSRIATPSDEGQGAAVRFVS